MLISDVKVEGKEATIKLKGKLDATTASQLKEKLEELTGDVTDISLDMSDLAYTSSSGLRLFLQYHNQLGKAGGKFTLMYPNDLIMDIFEDTGMANSLNIVR
jgi:anti-anti-sigma factor